MIKNNFFRICLLLLIFLVSLFLFFKFSLNKKVETKTNTEDVVKKEDSKEVSCTRTTRLDNSGQYDRALSLIQERVAQQYANKDFKYFPSQLTNCIKIIEEKSNNMDNLEGYFTFNSEKIDNNYYPIIVNSNYTNADYITTALLLSHEMTHVQQYIDLLNNKDKLSCVEKEVDAFMSQMALYIELRGEESSSAYFRIKNDKNLHPQLQMIDSLIKAGKEGDCFSKGDPTKDKDFIFKVVECQNTYMRQGLRKIISQDDYYKKQCNL